MEQLLRIFPFLAAIIVPWCAVAQEIGFTATVDRNTFATGQTVRLTISLTNAQGSFSAPDLGGLVIVQGPMESSSFQMVNGRMSSTMSRIYVLTATKPGTYTIGPASARVAGGIIKTDPITLKVEQGATPPVGKDFDQLQQQQRDLFVAITVNKNKAYVGEQIIATYTLYSRYANIETSGYDIPTLSGFWSEDVDLGKTNWEPQMQQINGLSYRVAVLKKQVLFPQRSGTLRIDPMKLTCLVNRTFFNRGTELQVRSNAVELRVSDLPQGAPPSFSGAVGELELSASFDRLELTANEAMELTLRISGRSNLKLIDAPRIEFPADMEVYDPKVKDRITVNASGMSGSREFQYLVIPRHAGSYELPPVSFSFFDTRSGSYRTLESKPFSVTVQKGEPGQVQSGPMRTVKSDVRQLDQDIRFIRTGPSTLLPRDSFLFGSTPFMLGMATPAMAFLLLLAWRSKRERDLADLRGTRRKQADRVARQRLKEAAKALEKNDREGFHAAISKAITGHLADKSGEPQAAITSERVKTILPDSEEGIRTAREFLDIMDICAMARFAPVDERPNKNTYDRAADLITRIENLLGK